MQRARELVSQAAWRLRPQGSIGIEDLKVVDGKYLVSSNGSSVRGLVLFRVGIPGSGDDSRVDYAAALKNTLQQQRMRGLFEGLRRAAVPFIYVMLMNQAEDRAGEPPPMEFDLVVGTWTDAKKIEDASPVLEQRASVLSATLSVALPSATVARLLRNDLAAFIKSALLPRGRPLPQAGTASSTSALCSFGEVSPVVSPLEHVPEFYVPNAAEAGSKGILLGPIVSGGQEFHEFRLQLDDLRRHISILGMTGAGKSTTAASIVRQVADAGLPVLVLDWHNEYGAVVTEAGGKVVAPGTDDFALNPLEASPGVDPVEHVAMVSDIFSDIYHFTHPQAYMFRNALQKRLNETPAEEVPTIAALVKTIEAYPLRSAYDNETKVALLRRLVPLTQGQSGRALGGSGPLRVAELLETVVCVELAHMRDVQSRAIFSDVMLKMIYEEKVRSKAPLDHVTVVEEARNVAPARKAEDPPTVGERMVSELRKFGEAMIFVAQFPSHVAAEIVKNSGTKIVHRLGWPDDLRLVGDSMGLSQEQREFVTKLKVGEAVLGTTRIQKSMLVHVRPNPAAQYESNELSFRPES